MIHHTFIRVGDHTCSYLRNVVFMKTRVCPHIFLLHSVKILDTALYCRKRLYQSVFEYDLPLFNPEPCRFEFVSRDIPGHVNPWKESFRQLYRGVHVRPGYQDLKFQGRNISYFNTVQGALDYADERGAAGAGSSDGNNGHSALVFLHAGTYRGEFLVIDSNVALIGAAPGNVAESVILERESESTVMFVEGAKQAYAGHLTLKFSPDVTSTVPHHKHYCLEVGENCSPTIDHCIIRSTSVGKYRKHGKCDKLMLCTHSCILYQVHNSLKVILLLTQ